MNPKKKLNSLSDLGGFVYSTNQNEDFSAYIPEEIVEKLAPNQQLLEAHFSNKGRGGKTVTTIQGLCLTLDELKTLTAALKKRCGCGGALKDGVIEIQGEHVELLLEELRKRGFTAKKSGG